LKSPIKRTQRATLAEFAALHIPYQDRSNPDLLNTEHRTPILNIENAKTNRRER
jgi:hypothetical protein